MPHRFDAVSPEQRPPAPPVERRAAGDVDPRLLEILVCPLTKTTLEWDAEKQELISRARASPFRCATACRSCWRARRGRWRDDDGAGGAVSRRQNATRTPAPKRWRVLSPLPNEAR
jgi:hypothetical protein